VSTPLQSLLGNTRFASALEALNASRVGPGGSGDGDIVSWWFSLVNIGICHAASSAPNADDMASPQKAIRPIPAEAKEDLVSTLVERANAIFDHIYPAPTQDFANSWNVVLAAMVAELRQQWGGRTVRVHKRQKSTLSPEEIVKSELLSGTPIKDISEKTGLSRATVYRQLKKR